MKYPIMDPSGKVQGWLDSGRGVRVWESAEIGTSYPDQITPGDVDTSPGWRYPVEASKVLKPDDVTMFHRFPNAESLFSDTPAGRKAADRLANKLEPDNASTGAPLRVLYRYSVERIMLRETNRPENRAHVSFHWAVFRWSAVSE